MVYTILISIVFIAEIIIAVTIVQNLLRLDKIVLEFDGIITGSKTSIKDVSELSRKISEQWRILAKDFVDKTKRDGEDVLLRQLSKMLLGVLLVKLNINVLNKIRKSKITKMLAKGLSLLENMV